MTFKRAFQVMTNTLVPNWVFHTIYYQFMGLTNQNQAKNLVYSPKGNNQVPRVQKGFLAS